VADSRENNALLYHSLEPVIRGMGMSLIELSVFRSKGRGKTQASVRVKAVIYKDGIIGIEHCSRVHRGILPRLELAFPGVDIYLEVSSTGIDRVIKDGSEFAHYIGKGVRCYRTDISGWAEGILLSADEEKIVIRDGNGETALPYEIIAKARLSSASPSFDAVENKKGG